MKKLAAFFLSTLILLMSFPGIVLAEPLEPGETTDPVAVDVRVDDRTPLFISGQQLTVPLVAAESDLSLEGLVVNASIGGSDIQGTVGNDGTVLFVVPADVQEVILSAEEQTIGEVTFAAMAEQAVPFIQEISRKFNGNTGALTVKLAENEWQVTNIYVNNAQRPTTPSADGFTANLGNGFSPEPHDLRYVVKKGVSSFTITMGDLFWTEGELDVHIEAAYENGRISVELTDEKWGSPLIGLEVIVRIGSTNLLTDTTDTNGRVTFTQSVSDPSTVEIVVETQVNAENPDIKYNGTTLPLAQQTTSTTVTAPPTTTTDTDRPTTTTDDDPATTTTAQNVTTTTQTQPTITGAGTTSVGGDGMIALNVTYETLILGNFGLTQTDFADRARLMITPAMYESLVGTSGGNVMMLMRHANSTISPQMITQATAGNSAYTSYDVDRVTHTTFSLALVLNDPRVGEVIFPAVNQTEGTLYTIQLPVPAGMKNADIISVAVYGENGISNLTQAEVKDGYIRFTTNNLSTFTLLGFIPSAAFRSSGTPAVVIVMLVIAALLFVGAILLIVFFVIRKPKGYNDPPTDGGGGRVRRRARAHAGARTRSRADPGG